MLLPKIVYSVTMSYYPTYVATSLHVYLNTIIFMWSWCYYTMTWLDAIIVILARPTMPCIHLVILSNNHDFWYYHNILIIVQMYVVSTVNEYNDYNLVDISDNIWVKSRILCLWHSKYQLYYTHYFISFITPTTLAY